MYRQILEVMYYYGSQIHVHVDLLLAEIYSSHTISLSLTAWAVLTGPVAGLGLAIMYVTQEHNTGVIKSHEYNI